MLSTAIFMTVMQGTFFFTMVQQSHKKNRTVDSTLWFIQQRVVQMLQGV